MRRFPDLALSVVVIFVAAPLLAFFSVRCRSANTETKSEVVPVAVQAVKEPPPSPLPLTPKRDRKVEKAALATELSRLWTRDADRLVDVVEQAHSSFDDVPPLTFLLAIAHAETNGLVLDVSEAGAVGLAQATPTAYLSENFSGKLYVTDDYITGAKAYLLKKPLHDAEVVAAVALDGRPEAALALLEAARELQTEGVAELEYLIPFAEAEFAERIEQANDRNRNVLLQAEKLVLEGDTNKLEAFRDEMREEYRAQLALQRRAWRRYQLDLAAQRDALIEERFGEPASVIKKTRAYEAGEYLATVLDERFSPAQMACFLAQHLRTKQAQARNLSGEAELERMTAALYNGGSHNVKRMRAGLIARLAETENYMRKVPSTRVKLELALETVEPVATAAMRSTENPDADATE